MSLEQSSVYPSVRILVVDDHELVREGVTARLASAAGLSVVGEASCGEEAVDRVTELMPDVVVIDYQLPDGNGVTLCRRVRGISPLTRCVIYTATGVDYNDAIAAGASAVVLKQLVGDQLIETINAITANSQQPFKN